MNGDWVYWQQFAAFFLGFIIGVDSLVNWGVNKY